VSVVVGKDTAGVSSDVVSESVVGSWVTCSVVCWSSFKASWIGSYIDISVLAVFSALFSWLLSSLFLVLVFVVFLMFLSLLLVCFGGEISEGFLWALERSAIDSKLVPKGRFPLRGSEAQRLMDS
jgi:hypothetical protein